MNEAASAVQGAEGADNLHTDFRIIDEALVTFFGAPNSYTAEDLVEIAAHGSPVVLELLLRRALELGARLAEPGEFTQRAFLAGRLDLTQAEAVRDLIDAQTLTQARQAASQMGGALSHRAAPAKQSLVELIALLEAGIDFAEDDIDVTPQAEIARRIDEITPPLTALEASFARGRIVHDGLTLAIVGRPNVGKSSLFNRLVERDRAIVTATPGTTRDLVTERISIDGIPIELVDTAGFREGARELLEEAEQLGILRSDEALADAALVLIVLDATQPLTDEDQRLLAAVEGRPAIVALNKSDLVANEKRAGRQIPSRHSLRTHCAPNFSAHRRRHCRAARTNSVARDGRRCGRAGDVDQSSPAPGRYDSTLGAGRCREGQCRCDSSRDDSARSLSLAVGAGLAHWPDHFRRHSESDLFDFLHRKVDLANSPSRDYSP